MQDMTPIDQLLALEEIRLLKARRDRAVDTKDWDGYESLHAEDHFSDNDGFERWDRSEMIARTRAHLEHMTTAHHSHTPEIIFDSPTSASGIWAMEDQLFWTQSGEPHWLHGYGFYHETYAKRDGRWVFTSRRLKRTMVHSSPGAAFGTDQIDPLT